MGRVLFLVNHDIVIYNFRKELVERLIHDGFDVAISSPQGERIAPLVRMGCKHYDVTLDRHGKNPLHELRLLRHYKKLIRHVRPDIIFSYTIKPNIYGSMAAAACKVPIVANITGLGTAVENAGLMTKAMVALYKIAFRKVRTVFVQNTENMKFFLDNKIATDKLKLLPGSGVNLKEFHVMEYPGSETLEFVFIARIMKEKGIDQYLETATAIRKRHLHTRFHVCGFCEDEYEDILKQRESEGTIIYHGLVRDIREVLARTHCTIHPSYYPEGISNVLLESAASGRPIITTNRSGCREVVEDGINGYLVPEKDTAALTEAVEKFISLTDEERMRMGMAGRAKVEREFDRQIVVEKYMEELRWTTRKS